MTAEAITTAAQTTTTARTPGRLEHHMKIITTTDGDHIRRVSRWLRIKTIWVTPRHSLAEYVDGGAPGWAHFFEWQGRRYALGRFIRLGGAYAAPVMWYDDDGKLHHLSGADCETYHNPIMIEMDDGVEHVRVYEPVE